MDVPVGTPEAAEELNPPIPGTEEADRIVIPEGVEGASGKTEETRVTAADDPFPDTGFVPSDARLAARPAASPAARGRIGRYIFFFICAAVGAFAAAVVGTVVSDACRASGIAFPALFYGEVVNSGVAELPTAGRGRALMGKVRIPYAPSVGDGGAAEKPGALEADAEDGEDEDGGPERELPILSVDVSAGGDGLYSLINETPYEPDVRSVLARERAIPTADELFAEYGEDAPLVLIFHTHGTESYSPEGASAYSSRDPFRSENADEGVVAVGETVRRTLEERGIPSIHLTEMFDRDSFADAYPRSAAAVTKILGEFPSVKYVLDVHRDALITKEGVNLRPVAEYGGRKAAQLMTVVGTDAAGSGHVGWEDNLALALFIQRRAEELCPSLMRPVDLRSESFSQQLSPGFLLLEAGAAANSLDEAKRGAAIYAEALADYIMNAGS
ncbi:MAG: stage II sporulation protein P [Clostridia bacterium]|nr:stage II sporulation protein P [Clostridia bacterium]